MIPCQKRIRFNGEENVFSQFIENLKYISNIGANLWTGGRNTLVIPTVDEPHVKKGDNIGCALDLSVPIITFFYNGMKIPGYFRNFNLAGMFFPVISASAKISCRFLFGGEHGRLKYSPPDGFSPIYDSLLPTQVCRHLVI